MVTVCFYSFLQNVAQSLTLIGQEIKVNCDFDLPKALQCIYKHFLLKFKLGYKRDHKRDNLLSSYWLYILVRVSKLKLKELQLILFC